MLGEDDYRDRPLSVDFSDIFSPDELDDPRAIFGPGATEADEIRPNRSTRRRLKSWLARDAEFDPAVRAIVKGVLSLGELALLYGPSGAGKSFFALLLAFAIACGFARVGGRRVRSGLVVYVAFEGGAGLKHRVCAARDAFGDPGENLVVIEPRLSLGKGQRGDEGAALLLAEIRQLQAAPALIVVDTVSCAMAGDDENAAGDVSAFMARLGRLAAETGAAVMAVHHSGKDASKGARGNSAFRANSDVVLEITDDRRVLLEKVRDGRTGEWATFALKPTVLGTDEDGDEVSTCVAELTAVAPTDATKPKQKQKRLAPVLQRALDVLHQLYADGQAFDVPPAEIGLAGVSDRQRPKVVKAADWRAACESAGLSPGEKSGAFRQNFSRASRDLPAAGRMAYRGEFVWLLGQKRSVEDGGAE